MRVGRRDVAAGIAGACLGVCLCLVATPIVRNFHVRHRTRALFAELVATPSKYSHDLWRGMAAVAANSRYPVEYARSKLDGDGLEPHLAIELVVSLGDVEDIFRLRHLLQHPDREIRLTYVAMLNPGQPGPTRDLLGEALEDDDEGVRLNAFCALLPGYGVQDEMGFYLDAPARLDPCWLPWAEGLLPRVKWDKHWQTMRLTTPETEVEPSMSDVSDAATANDVDE